MKFAEAFSAHQNAELRRECRAKENDLIRLEVELAGLHKERDALREKKDFAVHVLDRFLKWLRGDDPEFSNLIVEFRHREKAENVRD